MAAAVDFEQQLREANTQLYEHSRDLAVRNKILSLLRKLYQTSIQSLDPRALGEQIVGIVLSELELELAGILLYDAGTNSLRSLTYTGSKRLLEACEDAECGFFTHDIPNVSSVPFLKSAFQGSVAVTENLGDLWDGTIPDSSLERIAAAGHIRELLVEPLRVGEKVQGVLILGFNRSTDELSQFERESIYNLVDVVAIALDRAQLYEELKMANERQVTLIHFITHQIKGFVTKSRYIFSMALDGDFGPVTDQLRPMLEEGLRSDTQGVNTIQDILNAANIKSGKVAYKMEPFDLKNLIDQVVNVLAPNAQQKGLELKLETGTEPFTITGDREQLRNAFKNLVDNSIKYTPTGSVRVALAKEAGKAVLRIEDTGVGITPEDMKNLFTEGGHGKESTKVNVESTGFGLYIVKNIIEAHKGAVRAESDGAGKGSRFIVELPM